MKQVVLGLLCALGCASAPAKDWRLLPEVANATAESAYICHLWDAEIYAPGEKGSCYMGTIFVVDLEAGEIRYHHRGDQGLPESQQEREHDRNSLASALKDGGFQKLDELSDAQLKRKAAAAAEAAHTRYLGEFNEARTLEGIAAFEQRYRDSDPDGLIVQLGPLKVRLQLEAYRSAYQNATTSSALAKFIDDYQANDADGLVPEAKKRLNLFSAQEAEAVRLADKRRGEQQAAAERNALKMAANERKARLRFIASLKEKYAPMVKAETPEGYQRVAQFHIRCPNAERRVIPLLNLLYLSSRMASAMGGQLTFSIMSQGKQVRIYSQPSANGKERGPAVLSYVVSDRGELQAIGGQRLGILNLCYDTGDGIWLEPGDPGY